MSKPSTTEITCPKCRSVFEITYWASVNATLNPELREQVLSGSICNHRCPRCQHVARVVPPMVYHDMNRKFMLSLEFGQPSRTPNLPPEFAHVFAATLQDYHLRLVPTWNQLIEKINIFENALDDVLLEFLKLWVGERALGTADFPDGAVLFREKRNHPPEEPQLAFEVHRENGFLGVYTTPISAYDNLARQAADALARTNPRGEWKTVNQGAIRGK